jgi:multidrug efflux pump subunit AcrA (membrane-fusion protein)
MFMDLSLVRESRDALTVPEAAVVSRGPRQLVYRVENGGSGEEQASPESIGQRVVPPPQPSPTRGEGDGEGLRCVFTVTMEIGVRRGGWVEVRSGLAVGDRVVTEGHAALGDGTRVRLGGEVVR